MTWEDQQNINSFGKLNNRKLELSAFVRAKKARFGVLPGGGGRESLAWRRSPTAAASWPVLPQPPRAPSPSSFPPPPPFAHSARPPTPLSPLPTTLPPSSPKQTILEELEDASNELMLADDDEEVRYVVGECFMAIDKDAADERIAAQTTLVQGEIEEHEAELSQINGAMEKLKKVLYGKFGTQINLEDE